MAVLSRWHSVNLKIVSTWLPTDAANGQTGRKMNLNNNENSGSMRSARAESNWIFSFRAIPNRKKIWINSFLISLVSCAFFALLPFLWCVHNNYINSQKTGASKKSPRRKHGLSKCLISFLFARQVFMFPEQLQSGASTEQAQKMPQSPAQHTHAHRYLQRRENEQTIARVLQPKTVTRNLHFAYAEIGSRMSLIKKQIFFLLSHRLAPG